MAGLGAIGGVVFYLFTNDEKRRDIHMFRMYVSWGIFVIVVSAAMLDIFYYQKLLDGAVNALLEYESMHPGINMSTHISAHVGEYDWKMAYFSYATVLTSLLLFSIKMTFDYCKKN